MLFYSTSGKTFFDKHLFIANCRCVPIDILLHLKDHVVSSPGAAACFGGN